MNLTLSETDLAPATLDLQNAEPFKRAVWISIFLHALFFISFTVKNVFFSGEPLIYENAIRVDLVALPDKLPPAEQAREAPEPEVTPKPLPKATPKEMKKVAVKQDDAVNLEKSHELKEKAALKKLQQMDALEKIKKQIEAEQRIKAAAKVFKGNQLSSGTELTGLSKMDHDNYIANVKRKIYDNWDLPEWLAKKDLKAQVIAKFDEHGNLIFKKLLKSSGNPSYDENILEALQKSSPVPMPPEKLSKIISQEGILIGFPE